MRVQHYLDKDAIEDAPGIVRRVLVGPDDGATRFVMRLFEVSPGTSTPFHCHAWEHEVYVISGTGVAKNKACESPISEGTSVFVTPGEQHCFTSTGNEPLRFICVIPML